MGRTAEAEMGAPDPAAPLEGSQAEIALEPSDERFRRIVETTHEGLCLLSVDSTITFVNSRMCDMLGYSREDLLGRHSADIFGASALVAPSQRKRPPRQQDVALRHKDGSTVWAIASGTPLLDDSGRPAGVLAMLMNVTERNQSRERANSAAALLQQLTADAIYIIDTDGQITSWNHGAEQLFGWKKEEVVGRVVTIIPPELEAQTAADRQRITGEGQTLTKETLRLHKDGRSVPVLGSWSPVPMADGRVGVLCILKDLRAHKLVRDQLEDQARSLALLRERDRIAMDLHDGVIQSLYGVTLSLGALRRQHASEAPDEAVLGQAISQMTEIIQDIRDYIFELRTGVPQDTDLEAGLKAKVHELVTTTGVRPRLSIQADLRKLSPERASHLLYIVHEALSNVARHAKATDVVIEAVAWGSDMLLTITDNGQGFDAAQSGRRVGDGLCNMRERANLLGATLIIDTAPGGGTTVKVEVT